MIYVKEGNTNIRRWGNLIWVFTINYGKTSVYEAWFIWIKLCEARRWFIIYLENSRWGIRGFHFMASDSQMRELTQLLYIIFAGLNVWIYNSNWQLRPHAKREDNSLMFTIPATADHVSIHKKSTDIQDKNYVNALLTKHIFCKYLRSHLVQLL